MALTIELIFELIQIVTLYYSQRLPDELSHFDWLIDRKDQNLTLMEKRWTTLIVPIGHSRGREQPFITLKEGDYSHFDRFRLNTNNADEEKAEHLKWLNDNIRLDRPPGQRRPST
jgi:hypothetical protein